MYIYNVTFNIEQEVYSECLEWMKETHIPQMLQTNLFTNAKVLRVMVDEPMGGVTFSVQFYAKDKQSLERYYAEYCESFKIKQRQRFNDQLVSFSTDLKVLSEH